MTNRSQLWTIADHPQGRNQGQRNFGEQKVFETSERIEKQDVVEEEIVEVESRRPERDQQVFQFRTSTENVKEEFAAAAFHFDVDQP